MQTDRLRDDYLRRLETAASALPRERRDELVDEIREHLDAALADAAPDDELAVRNAIERLGPPDEIVRAAAEPVSPETRARTPWLEIAALVALVVPFGGWLAGIVLVAVSRLWSGAEKTVGIAVALVPAVLTLVLYNWDGGDVSGWWVAPLEIVAYALLFFSGVLSALFLGWRLRARRAA